MATNIVLASELGAEFKIGTVTPNKITVGIDGSSITQTGTNELQATEGSMTYNTGTSVLTYTGGNGTVQNISLAGLTTDIYVNGATFNAATSVLTLTDNDGVTPDVVIDLSALLGVSTDANNVLTDGSDSKPFISEAVIQAASGPSTDAGNLIATGVDNKPFLDCTAVATCSTIAHTSVFGTSLFSTVV